MQVEQELLDRQRFRVFTERYALNPYVKQTFLVFKGLIDWRGSEISCDVMDAEAGAQWGPRASV
jgi:hypothetical protein